ncbi:MAG: flagellar hook-length control protein FliK, partial [Calditrichaeota bacterium]|nr:flagellar hook-length control protein FliK [Calditrichota bacterium]
MHGQREPLESLAREVAVHVRLLAQSEEERLSVVLEQTDLGRIAVDLRKQDQAVTAHFRVESAETETLLKSSLEGLRAVLSEQGVQVGDLTVAVDGRHEHGSQQRHGPKEPEPWALEAERPGPSARTAEPARPRKAR